MKVKIKGLVFVGFAAAILSANAMADDTNTVTSKSYVDAKYVGKANDYIDVSLNTTTQKNDVSIKAAKLADTVAKVHAGDEKLTTAQAVKAYTNGGTDGELATFNANGALTSTHIVTSTESQNQTTGWVADNFVGSDTAVPSEKAVVDALNAMQDEIDQSVTDGFQPKTENADYQIGMANGTWKTLVDGTNTTIGTDATTGNVKVNVTEMTGANGTNAGTAGTVPAPSATDNTKFLRGDKSWVQAVQTVKANGAAVTIGTDNAVNFAEGATDGTVAVNGQDVAVHNAEVTTDKAEAIVTSGANANFESTTKYASTKAVYDYVQAQTGGTIIPTMSTQVCTASTPCALVAEASGAVHWRTMATATDAGGACGDATGNCQ